VDVAQSADDARVRNTGQRSGQGAWERRVCGARGYPQPRGVLLCDRSVPVPPSTSCRRANGGGNRVLETGAAAVERGAAPARRQAGGRVTGVRATGISQSVARPLSLDSREHHPTGRAEATHRLSGAPGAIRVSRSGPGLSPGLARADPARPRRPLRGDYPSGHGTASGPIRSVAAGRAG